MLQDAHWNVSAREAEPLEQEAARGTDADLVRTPVLKTVANELLDVAEALSGGLIKILLDRKSVV